MQQKLITRKKKKNHFLPKRSKFNNWSFTNNLLLLFPFLLYLINSSLSSITKKKKITIALLTFQFNIFFVANELLLSKYYWCRTNLTMLYSSLIFNFSATLIKLQWFDNNKQGILFFFFFTIYKFYTHSLLLTKQNLHFLFNFFHLFL